MRGIEETELEQQVARVKLGCFGEYVLACLGPNTATGLLETRLFDSSCSVVHCMNNA